MNKLAQYCHRPLQVAWRQCRVVVSHNPRALFLTLVMTISFMAYTVNTLLVEARYKLSVQSLSLIGAVNEKMAKKVVLDKKLAAYRFNAENITPEMTGETDPSKVASLLMTQKQQTGGGGTDTKNLYSLDLPIDPTAGTKIYDSNSKTSFKLIPEFAMDNGRSEEGRVVYPIDEGGQAIYSIKGNGIKEDLVLAKPRGNALNFHYRLELPASLQARLDERGNLGVYGVDPAISSALSDQSSSDAPVRLKDIQVNGVKNHLIYLIPAPTIVQSGSSPTFHQARAMYHLNGNQLTVEASGLEALTYPITIDPSVVVTSTADFALGNDEGNISFDTDAISRAKTGEPTIGTWTATTSLPASLYDHATVTYNGFIYAIGGRDANGAVADVRYAPINSNGTIGAWTATTSLVAALYGHAAVAYNGYLYAMGGTPGGGYSDVVRYALINADGSIGAWTSTSSMIESVADHAATAYNGYMYTTGGYYFNGSTTSSSKVGYAPINADGTIGAWTATTAFSTPRSGHSTIAYNGYLYVIGGLNQGVTYINDVRYAPINDDGTIGAWMTATSLTSAVTEHDSFAYKGYLYRVAGRTGASSYLLTVEYAPINANGSIGSWVTTSSLSAARYSHRSVAYGGNLYTVGGNLSGAGPTNSVLYSAIDASPPSVFTMSNWSATTTLGLASGSATVKALTRQEHSSVAYNGYLYVIGGRLSTTTPLTSVHSAPINADGTIGAWTATGNTALPAARFGHTSVVVNGYIYVVGGQDASNVYVSTAYYAQIGAGGAVGSWTTTSALPAARAHHGMTNYNGYMYVASGYSSTGVYTSSVYYAVINADGSLGTWTATTSGNADEDASVVAYNGYLYLAGALLYYAPINANGTIGAWTSDSDYPTSSRNKFPSLLISGHIVGVGGFTNTTLSNQSFISKFNADGSVPATTAGTSFTTGRSSHAVALYGDKIYITGGSAGAASPLGDVQFASAIYGPAASTAGSVTSWQGTTASSLAVYGHASVVYNNYIYMIGGFGGGAYRSDIRYAPINADGTIGTWVTASNSMSLIRFNAAAAIYGGYVYVSGGQQAAGVFTNTVEYAKINADGSLGTWTTSSNAFTTARYGHVSVAYNGKLYVVGGGDAVNAALGDVKYATINPADGSLGSWNDATATTAARDTDGFIYGGRLYVLGGVNGTTYSNTVRYAQINSDGTLGSWMTSGNVFATARSRHATVAVDGYMYVSGGGTSGLFSDLQYAPINVDGSIGTWKSTNSRASVAGAPTSFAYHTMNAYKGRLYDLGGIDGANTPQAGSYLTSTNAPALTATYSSLINLGQQSTLNSVVLNGLTPPGQGVAMFRTAGASGVFGAWQLPSVLSGTPIANVQYIMYKIMFDDSKGTAYSATTTQSSITDVTVDYTLGQSGVSPDVRLRHNKYFNNNEVLQSLETQ